MLLLVNYSDSFGLTEAIIVMAVTTGISALYMAFVLYLYLHKKIVKSNETIKLDYAQVVHMGWHNYLQGTGFCMHYAGACLQYEFKKLIQILNRRYPGGNIF